MASTDLVPSYAELFPELPAASKADDTLVVPIKPRTITDVFSIPIEEQRYRQLDEKVFGSAAEQNRVCSEVSRTTDTQIELNLSKDRTLTICIAGKRDAVKEAKKLLLQKLQKQASLDVYVPKNHHSFIIGKEGKIVKEIMDQTSTIVRIPRSDDPSEMINVAGTAENIRAAITKIQLIADEKAKMDIVRLPIIKAFHALLAGHQSSEIKKLSEAHSVRIHVPPHNVVKDEIVVSGEKQGVAIAVATLNARYAALQQTCGELPVPIEKNKHKFVRGPQGSNLDEIFKTTGVHVELPSAESEDNVVVLRGNTAKLEEALKLVYHFANSMVALTIKVPDWLHRHLIGPKGANVLKIREAYPKVHVNFGDNDNVDIEGPTAEAQAVQANLNKQVAELKSRLTFAEVKGNPQHYRHLIGAGGSNINKLKKDTGVQIQMPANDGVSDVIRIEGSSAGVATAKAAIEATLKKIADSKSVDVIIDQRFHAQLIGAKGANIKEMIEKFGGISFKFPGAKETSDIIVLRGDKKNVDAAEKFLKSEVKRLQESNFVLEVPLYSQFIKYIIGRGGATLSHIQSETETRIRIPKDASETTTISITGTQKACEAARDQVLKIQQDQANVVTDTIEIDPKYFNAIIGAKGKVIKDIMAQNGGVLVTFPKEKNSNKVTIRGDRSDVDNVKALMVKLADEKALNSFTLELPVKKQFHRFIIGSKGSGVAKIKESTGVRIIFPMAQDEEADTITIVGKEASCQAARDAVLARVKELESIVEATVDVPAEFQRHFFQKSGEVLKGLTDEFGVVINFPREGETVVVRGGTELVPQAVARIQEIVEDLKAHITKTVNIAAEHHGFVVGTGGKNVQRLTAEHNVSIKFPKKLTKSVSENTAAAVETMTSVDEAAAPTENPADVVIVKGKPENVDAAIAALLALVPETEQVDFPSEYHGNIIGPKGESIRKLMADCDVNIKVPSSSDNSNFLTIKGLRANIDTCKAELAKRLVDLDKDKAERALRSFNVEIEVNAKHHRSFIGKGGANIQKLRDQFSVQFDFPKLDKSGNPIGNPNVIKITGYEDKVLAAQKHLLEEVAALDALTTVELTIDPRIHSRIIGGRGAGIKNLQDSFNVRINFPRDKDSSLVTVVGDAANVEDAVEEINALAEEFMVDVVEREAVQPTKQQSAVEAARSANQQAGFLVRDAPWSSDDHLFPSLGASKPKAPQGAWGRK